MDGRDGATSELPFVAKPKSNISKEGKVLYPYLVREEWDRARFLDEADPEEFYLEEFVLGENWYLLYYFSADGTYVKGAQRNFLQQGMGKSVVLARAMDYPEPEVEQAFAKRLSADGYRGFIMVELRRTSSGKAVTIEANPRCWGPFQLTRDADMGLFEIIHHGPWRSAGKREAFRPDRVLLVAGWLYTSVAQWKGLGSTCGADPSDRPIGKIPRERHLRPQRLVVMLYVRSLQTLTTKAILRRMEGREQAKQVLKERYAELSKHAHYQTVPEVLAEKLGIQFEVNEEWRGDQPRYPLILDYARKHQHQSERSLMWARTQVSSRYRWLPTSKMQRLPLVS